MACVCPYYYVIIGSQLISLGNQCCTGPVCTVSGCTMSERKERLNGEEEEEKKKMHGKWAQTAINAIGAHNYMRYSKFQMENKAIKFGMVK